MVNDRPMIYSTSHLLDKGSTFAEKTTVLKYVQQFTF